MVVAALLCGVLAACSGPAPATPPAPSSPPAAAVSIAIPAVTVTVTDSGAEPRATLAFRTTPQTDQQVSLSTDSSISQTVGDTPPSDQSTPEITLPLTARQPGPGEDATHTVELTVGTPSSPDATLAAALGKATGSTNVLTIGPNGAISKLTLNPPDALSDAGRAAVEQALRQAVQFAPVLPTTAIGVGAVWSVSQQIDSIGLALRQETVLTLTAVREATITLGVRVTQTPLTPTWTLPNDKGTLDIDTYRMSGEGTLTVDLSKPLPIDGRVQQSGEQVYSQPKSELKLAQTVSNGVAWKS